MVGIGRCQRRMIISESTTRCSLCSSLSYVPLRKLMANLNNNLPPQTASSSPPDAVFGAAIDARNHCAGRQQPGGTMKSKGLISVLAIMFLRSSPRCPWCLWRHEHQRHLRGQPIADSAGRLSARVDGVPFQCAGEYPTRGDPSGQALLDATAASLQAQLNGSANLGGQNVTYDGTTITIPRPRSRSCTFSGTVTLSATSNTP